MEQKLRNGWFAWPNLITLCRIMGTGFFWTLFWSPWFFAGLALSDKLDGWVARNWNLKSRIGETIDPFADKLLVLPLVWHFWAIGEIATPLLMIIAGREAIVVLCKCIAWIKGIPTPSLSSGKYMFTLECVALFCLFYGEPIYIFASIFWFAVVVCAIASVVEYGEEYGAFVFGYLNGGNL